MDNHFWTSVFLNDQSPIVAFNPNLNINSNLLVLARSQMSRGIGQCGGVAVCFVRSKSVVSSKLLAAAPSGCNCESRVHALAQ